MKTKATFLFIILFTFALTFSASGQGTSFSGEWRLNTEKTVLAENQLFLLAVTIQLRGDSLFTTRTYSNGNGEEYPFEENLTLDSKEYKITIYDMPRTSKASKSEADGALLIESTTTFNGQYGEENLVAKETWKVDKEGKTLTIDFTNKMSDTETKGTYIYIKVK
jgi:hypothetical protein